MDSRVGAMESDLKNLKQDTDEIKELIKELASVLQRNALSSVEFSTKINFLENTINELKSQNEKRDSLLLKLSFGVATLTGFITVALERLIGV